MKLLTKFNLILLMLFGAGGLIISPQLTYTVLFVNARRDDHALHVRLPRQRWINGNDFADQQALLHSGGHAYPLRSLIAASETGRKLFVK